MRKLNPEKRKAILKAARSLFIRDGYASVKISDIATEAGIASGTLYLYFKSKEDLASAIGEDFFVRLSEQFKEVVKNFRGPDGVVILIDWALQVAEQEKDILAFPDQDGSGSDSRISQGKLTLVIQLRDVIQTLMSEGLIRKYKDAGRLAEFVFTMLKWVVHVYSKHDKETLIGVKETAVTVLQHALFDDLTLTAHRLVESRKS